MPTTVYAWPPVGVTGSEWTELAPVNVSRDIFTGDEMLSAAQRKRRLATLTVSALAAGRNGAGYMEMLKRLTAGGEALVRLRSHPVNWHVDAALEEAARQSVPILKTSGGVDWDWDDAGVPLLLYEGRVLEG
ncbi:hypothetical protein, partial [Oceanicella sp. SM1341]|uniref:hypothetical protein n=1 Tax=Oceanicella sp. SM1341 TaxID=1548889 RepID=UPI00130059C2